MSEVQINVQKMLDSREYWVLEVLSEDWIPVIQNIFYDFFRQSEPSYIEGQSAIVVGEHSILFLVAKRIVPVEELARRLSTPVDNIIDSEIIRLEQLFDLDETIPLPNVSYEGRG